MTSYFSKRKFCATIFSVIPAIFLSAQKNIPGNECEESVDQECKQQILTETKLLNKQLTELVEKHHKLYMSEEAKEKALRAAYELRLRLMIEGR